MIRVVLLSLCVSLVWAGAGVAKGGKANPNHYNPSETLPPDLIDFASQVSVRRRTSGVSLSEGFDDFGIR